MKNVLYLLIPALFFAACSGNKPDKGAELAQLKKQRSEIDTKIKSLEGTKTDSAKVVPVGVLEVQPTNFNAYVEVHSQISGDEDVLAAPQAMGTVKSITVRTGEHVSKGQVLATLDDATVEVQIEALAPQLNLTKSLYEKQQNLWSQNIGTEVQLMSAKAQYEGVQKQIAALRTNKSLYRIVSPINGTVDAVTLKVGDYASPQGAVGGAGIRVVSYDKLKAEAYLGENYLGTVKQGNPVKLILQDINDSINTNITYVSQVVDPVTRAFLVQVRLGNNSKLHPNMSCIMKIANYQNPHAIVVPVSVIQKTSQGSQLYIDKGGVAKSVTVTTGRNSNGQVEILSGLNPGDKVIVVGYEAMEDGEHITIQ